MRKYGLQAFVYDPKKKTSHYELVVFPDNPLENLYDIDFFTAGFLDKYALLSYLKDHRLISEDCNALSIAHFTNKKSKGAPSYYKVVYDSPILQECAQNTITDKIKNREGKKMATTVIKKTTPSYVSFCKILEEQYEAESKKILDKNPDAYDEVGALLLEHNQKMRELPRYKYFRGLILEMQEETKNKLVFYRPSKPVSQNVSYKIHPSFEAKYEPAKRDWDEEFLGYSEEELAQLTGGDENAEYNFRKTR